MKPISPEQLREAMRSMNISDVSSATIRQIAALAEKLQPALGADFVHLEMGNPGLPAASEGIEAECAALRSGVANMYPNVAGIKPLKEAGSQFIRAFFNADIEPRCIVPTVGSMQATFTLFILLGQRIPGKDTILYLDPGFPAQHHQAKLLGLNQRSIDIYECRGKALKARLEEALADGHVTAIIYSNPNNPAWTNLTEEELEIIGGAATEYDVIVLEDNAYLGMDFRRYYGKPYEAPYIPTIARYTDNYILLISASKIFSYAGQRIAMVCMSSGVADRKYDFLEHFYDMPAFFDAYVYGVLYCASSGTSHSPQYAFAEMLRRATDGTLDFVKASSEYGRRAALAKKSFLDSGFHLVYALDGDELISDGFFFTMGYPGLTGTELQSELLRYGISTISLPSTGSKQQGVRVCVSLLNDEAIFKNLSDRLAAFHRDHSSIQ